MAKKQKFYITTSIMYANADPHLGFAMELLQADVLARYRRLKGDDVFFLTGMDEHGKKIFESAKDAGMESQKFVDVKAQKVKDLAKLSNISNDFFIRTTDKKLHWPAVKKIWEMLEKKGDIYKKEYQGLYCVGCEAFKTNRELVDGKCETHLKEPEIVKEENYFFKLSKYLSKVQKLLEKNKIKIYPESRKLEAVNMIKDGIEDISVSRPVSQVSWGIPVPSFASSSHKATDGHSKVTAGKPGDDSQNIYVWFEALLNYISALGYAKSDKKIKKYWPADIHLIGKDILKFHAIIWPAILLAVGLDLPKNILVHGFITNAGQKMSKSLGNVIDPFGLIKKYGTDAVRYYFLSEAPMFADMDFTEEKFAAKYNSDLANGLGNLVNRILSIAKKHSILTTLNKRKCETNNQICKQILTDYEKSMKQYGLDSALKTIRQFIGHNNRLVEKIKLWELPKTNPAQFQKATVNLISNIVFIAYLIEPFMPETSDKILEMIKSGDIKPLFPYVN